VKQNPIGGGLYAGMGYYTVANAEVVFIATKGSPSRRPSVSSSALFSSPYLELYAWDDRARLEGLDAAADFVRLLGMLADRSHDDLLHIVCEPQRGS
jgi:hypothetical protein